MRISMIVRATFGILVILLMIGVHPLQAFVIDYGLFKVLGYDQTANNTQSDINSPDRAGFEAWLDTDNPADFSAVEVSGGASPLGLTHFGFGEWDEFVGFDSATPKADLDAAYPSNNDYEFAAESSLGTIREILHLGPDAYPSLVPFLTGNTFDDLSAMDVSQPFQLTWNAPASNGGVNITDVFYDISETTTGTGVFESADFLPSDSSDTLPASTLEPGEQYDLILFFLIDTLQSPPVNFSSGEAYNVFGRAAIITFTTPMLAVVPEPASFTLLAFGAVGLVLLAPRRSRRRS